MIKQDARINLKISAGMKQGLEKIAREQGLGLSSFMKYASFLILNNLDDEKLMHKFKKAMVEYDTTEQKIYNETEKAILEKLKRMQEAGVEDPIGRLLDGYENPD